MNTDIEQLIAPSEALTREFELTDAALASSTHLLSKKQPRAHALKVANLGLLLNTGEFNSEVCYDLPICQLPNTSTWLHGIANQRGNMVPIFNLEMILGFEQPTERKNAQYLIFGQREQAIGILIYELPIRLLLCHEQQLRKTPEMPALLQPYVGKCYEHEYQIWIEWDTYGFFKNVAEQIAI